jgi:ParB-like chromosome segregation protein Spo0J
MLEQPAEWVELERLTPWRDNPRKNDKRAPHVAELIKRFGFSEPVVARRANAEIIAGHTRHKAAKLLVAEWARSTEAQRAEWHEQARAIGESGILPCRFMDLDESEAHLLALADNRATEQTPWDDGALRKLLPTFKLEDVALAGWSPDQLAKMLETKDATVQTIDTSALRDEFWISIRGPVPEQPAVLELLRKTLAQLDGVEVSLGMTGHAK